MKKFILILSILICTIASSVEAKTLTFVQVTDIHLSNDKEQEYGGRNYEDSQRALKTCIKSINKQKDIDFVIFSGDVINESNEKDLHMFFEMISPIKKPYYVLMGNHDVHSLGGMNKDTFLEIVAQYNIRQQNQERNFVIKPQKGITFLMLDSTPSRMPSARGIVTKSTLKWLDKQLKKNKNNIVVIAQHQPLVAPTDNESHSMFEPEKYREVTDKYNNIVLILSGHFHASNKIVDEKGITHLSTPALFENRNYNKITIEYTKPPFKPAKLKSIQTTLMQAN